MKKVIVLAGLSGTLIFIPTAVADIHLYGKAHIAVEYEDLDDSNADDGSDDHLRYVVSAYYKIGNGKLELQYVNAEELGDKDSSDQATIGWEHKLGGGASTYVAYSKRELEDVESDHASVGFIYKF